MKVTVPILCGLAFVLVSCGAFDPEYADYKKEKKAQKGMPAPYGTNPDPYGVAAANPYGVPSSEGGSSDAGSYKPSSSIPPYQPLPGVPNDPLPSPRGTPGAGLPNFPSAGSPSGSPGGAAATHTVVKGDSLWGLSKRYGSSVESIRQANGLTSDLIRVGQTLQIPKN